MDYKIDDNKIRLNSIKQTITEVEELKKMINSEGYDFTFDQVLKLYEINKITEKLEDIIPAE